MKTAKPADQLETLGILALARLNLEFSSREAEEAQ